MRLLVTGGSGFLGGYVLAEAARRGHECVALARSSEAARQVAARGATPLDGDLDDGAAPLGRGLRGRALRRAGQPGVARLRARPRDRRGRGSAPSSTGPSSSPPPRSPRGSLPASKAVRLAAEEAIRSSEPGVDDPAADHDLRRARRQEPVPAARAARPGRARSADLAVCRLCCRCPAAAAGCSSPSMSRTWPAAVLTAVERPDRVDPLLRHRGPGAADVRRPAARVRRRGRLPGPRCFPCRWLR